MWHTGKVLACGAVGPRFKPRQGQGILEGPILFWIRMAHYSLARRVGLVFEHFPFTNAASQWLYVNLVCRFHTRLGRFSPGTPVGFLLHLKIGILSYFWSLVVCIKPACLPEVWLPMCVLRLSHNGALRTQWVDMSRVTKTAKYYFIIIINFQGLRPSNVGHHLCPTIWFLAPPYQILA